MDSSSQHLRTKLLTIARSRCPDLLDATRTLADQRRERSDPCQIHGDHRRIEVDALRTTVDRRGIEADRLRKRSDPCQILANALRMAADRRGMEGDCLRVCRAGSPKRGLLMGAEAERR